MISVSKQWVNRYQLIIARSVICLAVLAGIIALAVNGALLMALQAVGIILGVLLVVWAIMVLLDHGGL